MCSDFTGHIGTSANSYKGLCGAGDHGYDIRNKERGNIFEFTVAQSCYWNLKIHQERQPSNN